MWIARPIYEIFPYLYIAAGLLFLGAAWYFGAPPWSGFLMLAGALSLLLGLVLWLRRRDYRTTQAVYNSHSLDD